MLTLQIDNKEIEQTLLARFKSVDEIKRYFYELVSEDLEDRHLAKLLKQDDKKDFVSKGAVFEVLDTVK
jgi:hypothetical protein